MEQETRITGISIIHLDTSSPYGRVMVRSSLGVLETTFTTEEMLRIAALADEAAMRAIKKAVRELTPIVEAGTLQLVLEHVPAEPEYSQTAPQPPTPRANTENFYDDIPF